MYHSITFGDKNTWTDWHLIPDSRPVFNPPSVKTKIVEIPGSDGTLDMTESLTGFPLYNDRTGSFVFNVENGHQDWQKLYSSIMGHLHGKKLRAVLEDDPNYYYEGRFWVENWESGKANSKITIGYQVAPYKASKSETLVSDLSIATSASSNFVNDILTLGNIIGDMPVTPRVHVSSISVNDNVEIDWMYLSTNIYVAKKVSYTGDYYFPDFILYGTGTMLFGIVGKGAHVQLYSRKGYF